ncbi:MAG: efflux RND transporter periplasmic adaptor subunit [Candidatus Omnitrophota bacterium]
MFKKKYVIVISLLMIAIAFFMFSQKEKNSTNKGEVTREIIPFTGDIRLVVTTTGAIEPQNRLELKPSVSGRVENILVKEGDKVKKGEVLAWMSSSERAALVDASTSQGEETREYWEEVYKQTPIIAPIDGEVIVRSVEPGQTVATSDAVLVLSDRLIVSAQFDETDVGKVAVGQKATVALDAYPKNKIRGIVDHIAYESELVNNVTIYDVDIVPQEVPLFFRSGMSANVEVVEAEKKGVLLIPAEALIEENNKKFVIVKNKTGTGEEKKEIQTGLKDEKNIEIISGITSGDIILVKEKVYSLLKKQTGTNPFMPFRGQKK